MNIVTLVKLLAEVRQYHGHTWLLEFAIRRPNKEHSTKHPANPWKTAGMTTSDKTGFSLKTDAAS